MEKDIMPMNNSAINMPKPSRPVAAERQHGDDPSPLMERGELARVRTSGTADTRVSARTIKSRKMIDPLIFLALIEPVIFLMLAGFFKAVGGFSTVNCLDHGNVMDGTFSNGSFTGTTHYCGNFNGIYGNGTLRGAYSNTVSPTFFDKSNFYGDALFAVAALYQLRNMVAYCWYRCK